MRSIAKIIQGMQALRGARAPFGPVRIFELRPCDNALALQCEKLLRQRVAIRRDVFSSAIIGGSLLVIAGFMHGARFLSALTVTTQDATITLFLVARTSFVASCVITGDEPDGRKLDEKVGIPPSCLDADFCGGSARTGH
jgi:hypothetical protein